MVSLSEPRKRQRTIFVIYQCGNIPISRQLHGYFFKGKRAQFFPVTGTTFFTRTLTLLKEVNYIKKVYNIIINMIVPLIVLPTVSSIRSIVRHWFLLLLFFIFFS